ncbi:hypothetical protein SAMN05192574_101949 [Mucilaginibacter gossypiicola]|uniref:Uncharacterized protein n=1 Tax=Mucilaginibacter gossypiicola TaxID=551995 RepID=A0A1H8BK32_9SPHI|nr:hypothetical protein SAMN05192574_101949 [Mucilaginibacter gossypiicola]
MDYYQDTVNKFFIPPGYTGGIFSIYHFLIY